LTLVKARLYGEVHAVRLAWPPLWDITQRQLAEHNRLELRLVDGLIRHEEPETLDALAQRVFDAETRAPTRPHPHLPHTGTAGLLARRLWAVADRFWDKAEGRVVPAPVRPVARHHDSLFGQYLVGDPQLKTDAALITHRRHRPLDSGATRALPDQHRQADERGKGDD
jgi:hypothetical protein